MKGLLTQLKHLPFVVVVFSVVVVLKHSSLELAKLTLLFLIKSQLAPVALLLLAKLLDLFGLFAESDCRVWHVGGIKVNIGTIKAVPDDISVSDEGSVVQLLGLRQSDCLVQSVGAQDLVEARGTGDKRHLLGGPRISVELGITEKNTRSWTTSLFHLCLRARRGGCWPVSVGGHLVNCHCALLTTLFRPEKLFSVTLLLSQ